MPDASPTSDANCQSNEAIDGCEQIRRQSLAAINGAVESQDPIRERQRLEVQHGQVWNTSQLASDFEVLGFLAPYVVVRRKSDGRTGSLEFQHSPRYYFNFVLDQARTSESH